MKTLATVFLRGIVRTVASVLVASIIALTVYFFMQVRNEEGYFAVVYFVEALVATGLSVIGIFEIGKGKNSRKAKIVK